MNATRQFRLLAQYNRRQNEQVYQCASRLTSGDLSADVGAYFQSIIGTLNHIAVADIIWLKRFATHPLGFESLRELADRPRPESLDATVGADLATLEALRQSLDDTISSFARELNVDHLTHHLSFTDTQGAPHCKSFALLLVHFFNHQTHHRGQVGTLLMQRGLDVGVTDFLLDIPESSL